MLIVNVPHAEDSRRPRKKREKNLNAKNKVLELFDRVADVYEAAGDRELALA